jgi:hypothetical protein
VSVEAGQLPFVIRHSNTWMPDSPFTVVTGSFSDVISAFPLISSHFPVPINGVFPYKVAAVAQVVWLLPASAMVGNSSRVIITVEEEAGQTPLLICHCRMD